MKCGILTFHKTTNYGAVLQAYALMRTVDDLKGIDCEIIDYRCEAVEQRYKILRKYETIKDAVKALLCAVPNAKLKNKFSGFLKEYCRLSAPITPKELTAKSREYDVIIVGSDQIWNPKLTGADENYFLPFVTSCKKIAYAASFGSFDDAKQIQTYYKNDISDFVAVSLREMDTVKYIGRTESEEIQQVLDPTFLMTGEEWKKEFVKERLVKGKYILVYKMMDAEGLFDFARKLGKEKGLPIIYLTHSAKRERGMKNIFTASPEEFLNYLYYAEIVVTSSFHGTALSVNLNKDFYYVLDRKNVTANRRIESLVNLLGLQNRDILCQENNRTSIDWNTVNQKLEAERKKSKEFLVNAIERSRSDASSHQ